jgi:hypothetical protein
MTKKAKVSQPEVKSHKADGQPQGWVMSDKIITNISDIRLEAPLIRTESKISSRITRSRGNALSN